MVQGRRLVAEPAVPPPAVCAPETTLRVCKRVHPEARRDPRSNIVTAAR